MNGIQIDYDLIGNPLSDGTWTYTWRHGRELASMSGNGTTWTFTYNADGLRTKRTNGSTTYQYVYNGSSLVQMTVGNNTLYFTSDTVTYNGTTYYYAKNLQGNIVAILNSSGTAVVQYTYDAWGKLLSTTGSMANTLGDLNPLRYRGYVYDTETGLYYLQSRYYNPNLGRFLNADALVSTGQGVLGNNMFAYCGNNPINKSDCSGYISEKIIYPVHYDNEQSAREDFVWVPYNGEPHPIDEFIFELTSSANPIDYLMTYEEIENLSGGISLASGVKHIRQGFMLILIPIPSLADEFWGVTRIMWGFRSVIKGIGQIFGGGEDK